MSTSIAQHYTPNDLLNAITRGLAELNLSPEAATVDLLAPVDEFHIGGREATAGFVDQLGITTPQHLLDVGCGLGGTARYVASSYGCQVTGIDLTAAFVDAGNELCRWVGLDDRIRLAEGSALDMPFADAAFDGAYMLHVGMNIERKADLFREVRRVLKPGALFGVYDIVKTGDGLAYPTPWAAEPAMSFVDEPASYVDALEQAGFTVQAQRNRRDFALDFYERLRKKMEAAGGPPPLGLHLLMGASTKEKLQNMIRGLQDGSIAPVEIVSVVALK